MVIFITYLGETKEIEITELNYIKIIKKIMEEFDIHFEIALLNEKNELIYEFNYLDFIKDDSKFSVILMSTFIIKNNLEIKNLIEKNNKEIKIEILRCKYTINNKFEENWNEIINSDFSTNEKIKFLRLCKPNKEHGKILLFNTGNKKLNVVFVYSDKISDLHKKLINEDDELIYHDLVYEYNKSIKNINEYIYSENLRIFIENMSENEKTIKIKLE